MIGVHFEGPLSRIAAIMWSILSSKNPYTHGCNVSLSIQLFSDRPDGTGKEQLWVTPLSV